MKGFLSWAGEKIASIKTTVSQTYSSVVSTISSITSTPFSYSFSIKWWEGFTRVLNPENVTKLFTSKKTRQALKESLKANVLYYLSLAMLMEYVRETIVNAIADDTEESWFTATNAVNMLISTGLGTIMLHRYYDNTLINLTLAKNVVDENKLSDFYKHCGCDNGALISAGVFSSVNLTGKKLSIGMASYLPVIKYLAPIASVFADGETLAEFPYSSAGMCTKHRAEALVKDNAYSFGIGCALYGVGVIINNAIYWRTGLYSFFISNAVYGAIYPYFITSVLLREKQIPGDKQGIDFFKMHRYVLHNMTAWMGSQIVPLIQQESKKSTWAKKLEGVNEYWLVKLSKGLLQYDIYGDWRTLKGIQTSPSTMLFFNEYYHLITEQLDNIIEKRDKSYIGKIVPVLPDKLTSFMMSEDYRALIKIVFDKNLDGPLKNARDTIKGINRVQEEFKEKKFTKVFIRDKQQYRESFERLEKLELNKPSEQSEVEDKKPGVSAEQPKLHLFKDQFFDIKEKKDVIVGEIKDQIDSDKSKLAPQNEAIVRSDSKEILSRSGSGEVSTVGLFSNTAQKPIRKISHRKPKPMISFVMDDYDGESAPVLNQSNAKIKNENTTLSSSTSVKRPGSSSGSY